MLVCTCPLFTFQILTVTIISVHGCSSYFLFFYFFHCDGIDNQAEEDAAALRAELNMVHQQQQANTNTTTSYSSSSFGGFPDDNFSALEKELHDLQTHLKVQNACSPVSCILYSKVCMLGTTSVI